MSGITLLGQMDWERVFTGWAQPPSQTEQERCDRAVAAVKRAIASGPGLGRRSTNTFPQGSYRNRTNVRQDSDVDLCVLCDETFYYDLPTGMSLQQAGINPASYLYDDYKNDVEAALVAHFGRDKVARGNKAFDVHENTYRIDADVVACFEYRLYYVSRYGGSLAYHAGTALVTDRENSLVTNFPQQQYDNGVAKNEATARQFKPLVRIIKSLRNQMAEAGSGAADTIPSFLIECLVWNWPNDQFGAHAATWTQMVRAFLNWLYASTSSDAGSATWMEENNIKRLFGPHNQWTRAQVNQFALAALLHIRVR